MTRRAWLFAVWLAVGCLAASAQTRWHVATGGDDGAAGTSWVTAVATVTNALARAAAGDAVWVAAGTYVPTADGTRTLSHTLTPGVALYGGFAGTESSLAERDWTNNPTVLSGDIGTPGEATDNAYHVVLAAAGPGARLDGFVVRDGYADGVGSNRCGGGLFSYNASLAVANCVFTNNAAIGPNSGISLGGGAYWEQGSLGVATARWESCVFTGNRVSNSTTTSYGGGLCAAFWTTSVFVVTGCVFAGNRGEGTYAGGAGLTLYEKYSNAWAPGAGPVIADTRFEENLTIGQQGRGAGARLQLMQPPVAFTNCRFIANRFDGGDNSTGGGGMYLVIPVTGHGVQMDDCVFEGNTCAYVGGAVSFTTSGGTNSVWRNCRFAGNLATNHGGAIAGAVDGTFEGCTFVSNRAHVYVGGAVRLQTAGAVAEDVFSNCVFEANQAGPSGTGGGGISVEAPVRLLNCRFEGNASSGSAGALNWNAAGGSVSQCVFAGNTAPNSSYGGAFRLGAAARARFADCTFLTNEAGWYGGAFHAAAGSCLEVEDGYFEGNRAVSYYGGAALIESTNVFIRRCVFVGNEATNTTGYGGALCYRSLAAYTNTAANSVFRNNAARYGGAIAAYNAHLAVSNCTLVTNRASQAAGGGGLYHLSASYTCRVENAILWGNQAAGAANQVYQPAGGGAEIRYSCVQGGFTGEGNLDADPLFADPVYLHPASRTGHWTGGYFAGGVWGTGTWATALAFSPMIDAGDPASAWSLEPRPNGGRINLGAYGNTGVASMGPKPSGALIVFR